ncbi:MAG: hypothetical protein J6B29_00205 [Clostridia bacterium]|nr:hypothetical protein [Clostridia bacterium]
MKWSEGYKVLYNDTNSNEIAGASRIFKYIQETANAQMRAQKPSYNELFNQGKSFILSIIRVEMYEPISYGEEILVKTWACPSRGFTFPRSYSIERNGEILCEANSAWALVDTHTKKLIKSTDVDLSSYCTDEPLELPNPIRFRIPAEIQLSLVGEYTVRYTDTDINGHMNNTNYPDMLFNAMPSPEHKIIKSIAISYQNEARAGDSLKLYLGKMDGKYYMRSVLPNGQTNVEAEIIVESIV